MEIRFILTREDLWHFLTCAFFRRRRRFFVLLLMYALLILIAVIPNELSFSLIGLCPLLILLLLPVLLMLRMRRIAAPRAARGGEHVVSITPEGIREKTDLGEGTRSWRTIKTITQDTYNLYLVTDTMDASAVMAVVIPRRAFAAPQDAETFLEEARQHWMQGRGMLPTRARAILPGDRQEGSTSHEP
jgi:uncharacterized protein (DUF58 family)